MKKSLLASVLLLSMGCGLTDPKACTDLYAYGLTVQVQDAATGGAITDGLTVTAQDGTYTETLQSVDGQHYVGAGERAGTYTIRVTRSGYQPWEESGVVVIKGECHVQGAAVTARLLH